MIIYRYAVHSHPDNMGEGAVFDTMDEARAQVLHYGEHGACISELAFGYEDSELVEDTRPPHLKAMDKEDTA